MKRTILMLTILCIVVRLSGQNYQTFRSDRLYFYEGYADNTANVHFDSLKVVGEDTILFPAKVPILFDYECMRPDIASWIGERVLIKNDGLNVFFNYNNDSIKIETKANVHDVWIAFENDSTIIKAEVTNKELVSFLGYSDSVKTITFQEYYGSENKKESNVNELVLKLSKNFGFFQTTALYYFPDKYELGIRFHPELNFALQGVNHPQMGIQNLTTFQVYDFKPGDEIHTVERSTDVNHKFETVRTIKASVKKYVLREDFTDSLVYYVEQITGTFVSIDGSLDYIYNMKSLRERVLTNERLDEIPGELWIREDIAELNNCFLTDSSKVLKGAEWVWNKGKEYCWYPLIIDYNGENVESEYMKGLGGPYYSYVESSFPDSLQERKLVYYKKGSETWGTPLTISVSEKSAIENENLLIYPNPAKEWVMIDVGSSLLQEIEVMDITGKRLMIHTVLNKSSVQLELKGLSTGVYVIKVSTDTKVLLQKIRVE